MGEAGALLRPGLPALPVLQGLQQQVVEVQPSRLPPQALIAGKGRVLFSAAVLPGGNLPQEPAGATLPPQLLQSGGGQVPLLPGISQPPPVPRAQQLQADGMEGADVYPPGRTPAQAGPQPFPQLPGRPVGKGDRRDLPRLRPLLQQMGNAGHQRVGLARPRPGNDRQIRFHRLCRRPLGLIGSGGGLRLVPGPAGSHRPDFPRRCGLFPGGLLHAEQAHLAHIGLPLGGREQLHRPIGPVVARRPGHLPRSQAADALGHTGPGHMADILQWGLAEDIELRPQLPEHQLTSRLHLPARCRAPG